jgi:ABC-type lipoprotein release transport system permease subunit
MKTVLLLAWKNIWRNKARSLALMMAIILGIAAGLVMFGLVAGMVIQRFDGLVENHLSHIQIHHKDYLREQENNMILPESDKIREVLEHYPQVEGYAFRTVSFGMIATGYNSSGVRIIGINQEEENRISRFPENLVEGKYLDDDIRYPVVLSQRNARKLRVQLGGRVVLTFQNLEGELTAAAFRVSGIFRTSDSNFDDSNIHVKQVDLQELLGNDEAFHQVAIIIEDYNTADDTANALSEELKEVEVRSWAQLSPELKILIEQGGFIMYIFMIIILLGLSFGILNTMLMAVFERMQELGMLLAIGMNKIKVAGMIVLETSLIAMIGGVIGIFLGIGIIQLFVNNGLDFSNFADALAEFGYDSVIYPILKSNDILITFLMVCITAIIAAIIPAIRAVQLNPSEAVRK